MNNPSHNASTSCFFARLPFTSVHGKLVSKVPQRAVHAGKIVQGRTACVNGFSDDVLDVACEFDQALGGRPVFSHQATGVPSWRNAGPVQRFANVDVAHANHRFLVEQGQFDDALVVFRKALQERADLHMAHEKVGVILSRKNVLEEAEYHLQRATDLLRTSQEVLNTYGAEYYYNLGECQLKLGKNDKAYQSFAKARDLDPESEFGLKARDVLKKFQARHG